MSDDRTGVQREADELLDAAIAACARAYDQIPGDAILVDFVVVSLFDSIDLHEANRSAYSYLTRGAGAPNHISLGLLALGTRYYGRGWVADDDD